ncbi:MAG: restriction endonuclease [Carboxylicivirga sp.]|jgi:hypothetical protein|nr:restriction endonuclease [Carboxylicivirga sp.]
MTWQEYQNAVGTLYENMKDMGVVKQNLYIPDKITGQKRQVDVWWELKVGEHRVNILIDAKYRKEKIDIKDLEEVEALAKSVKADKVIIVTNNGWTKPAETKAEFSSIDLRVLKVEEAFDLIIPDKWLMCYDCTDECVIMDSDGVVYRENSNLFFDWYAGKCRCCGNTYLHCPECGKRVILEDSDDYECMCNHIWKKDNDELHIKFNDLDSFQRIDNVKPVPIEFLYWLLGYSKEYWMKLILSILNVNTDKGNQLYFMINPDQKGIIKPDYIDEDGPVFYIPI